MKEDMSQYIQLKTSFFTHRKTMRLRSLIGDAALWVMPALWCYALNSQTDGDFSKWQDQEVALAIGYDGDAKKLVDAMTDSEYMTPDRHLHQWEEHQSFARMAGERARKAATARWGSGEEEAPTSKVKGTEEECVAYCVEVGLTEEDGRWFYDKMVGTGWKNGGASVKDWKATIRAWKRAGYIASQRQRNRPGPTSFSDKAYSEAQVTKLRDDLKFAPPEKREGIREAIQKHLTILGRTQ